MFSSKAEAPPAPTASSSTNETANDQASYQQLSEALITFGNLLKQRNFSISVSQNAFYSTAYLAETVMFVCRLCNEHDQAGSIHSAAGINWFSNQLPVMQNIFIEIAPQQLVDYIQQAIASDPLQQLQFSDELLQQLQGFIAENIRSQTPTTH